MDDELQRSGVTLVPLDDGGRVAVFAADVERARAVVAALGAPAASDQAGQGAAAAGMAGAVASAVGSGAQGIAQLHGVVQLAPHTLAQLQSGARLMTSGGWTLGTVVGQNGQIVGNAAFTAVGAGTSMATMAATMGTSVALAAVQLQLVRIQQAVEQVAARVEVLLGETREIRSAEIETRIDRVIRESRWAIELRHVPPTMVDELRGDGHALEAYCRSTVRLLAQRVDGLGRGKAASRQEALQQEAGQIARDVVNLHAAADCWLGYELLRASAVTASSPVYAAQIAADAAERTDEWRQRAAEQIAVLQQRLRRIDAAPGKGFNPRTKRTVRELARQLAEAVAAAIPAVEPAVPEPADLLGLRDEQRERLLQELRWRLDDGALLLLAGVAIPRMSDVGGIDVARAALRSVGARDGFVAVRGARVLVGVVKDFVEDGTLLVDVPRGACVVSGVEDDGDGVFTLGSDDERVRVVPLDAERRMAPSMLRHRVQRAVEFVPYAALGGGAGESAALRQD